jgi:hypothetical protein
MFRVFHSLTCRKELTRWLHRDVLNGLASGGELTIMPSLQKQRQSPLAATKAKNESSIPNLGGDRPPFLRVDPSSSFSVQGSMGDQQTPTATNWRNQSGMSSVIQPGFLPQSFPSSPSLNNQWTQNHSSSASTSSSAGSSSYTNAQQTSSFSSLADGEPLTGPSPMTFNSMMAQTGQGDFDMQLQQDWSSLDSADPLSLDVGMSNLWDWGIPFQCVHGPCVRSVALDIADT